MNKDGQPEIVIGGFDGKICVFKADGDGARRLPGRARLRRTSRRARAAS